MLRSSGWVVAFSLLASGPAGAASFDCAEARSAHDRAICGSPDLSALDDRLGALYQSKRAALSATGAVLLQRSERSWLRYMNATCPIPDLHPLPFRPTPVQCLEDNYRKRIDQLGEVAVRRGTLLFNRIDLFATEPDTNTNGGGRNPGLYVQHLTYCQIDAPTTAATARWNKINDHSDAIGGRVCDAVFGDTDDDDEVTYANDHVISVTLAWSMYCHGAPHGLFTFRSSNTVWSDGARALDPGDIFGSGWQPLLKGLFKRALSAKGWTAANAQAEEEVEQDVLDPASWTFTPAGLSVSFDAYVGGCYACNPCTTTVAWSDLKPLLRKGSLLP